MARVVFLTKNLPASTQEWRAKVRGISESLQAIGLRKTNDANQIDIDNFEWNDEVGANPNFGFEIYEFQDSLSAVAPLFVKIFYGHKDRSSSSSAYTEFPRFLRLGIQVGKGSDGQGNLLHPFRSALYSEFGGHGTAASAVNYDVMTTSMACHADGYLAIAISSDVGMTALNHSGGHGGPSFVICRTTDDTGMPNAEGVVIYAKTTNSPSSTSNSQARAYFSNYDSGLSTYSNGTGYCTVFGHVDQSAPGHLEVHKHYRATPIRAVNPYLLTYPTALITPYHTFQATVVGGHSRTYLTMPFYAFGSGDSSTPENISSVAILWE